MSTKSGRKARLIPHVRLYAKISLSITERDFFFAVLSSLNSNVINEPSTHDWRRNKCEENHKMLSAQYSSLIERVYLEREKPLRCLITIPVMCISLQIIFFHLSTKKIHIIRGCFRMLCASCLLRAIIVRSNHFHNFLLLK